MRTTVAASPATSGRRRASRSPSGTAGGPVRTPRERRRGRARRAARRGRRPRRWSPPPKARSVSSTTTVGRRAVGPRRPGVRGLVEEASAATGGSSDRRRPRWRARSRTGRARSPCPAAAPTTSTDARWPREQDTPTSSASRAAGADDGRHAGEHAPSRARRSSTAPPHQQLPDEHEHHHQRVHARLGRVAHGEGRQRRRRAASPSRRRGAAGPPTRAARPAGARRRRRCPTAPARPSSPSPTTRIHPWSSQ